MNIDIDMSKTKKYSKNFMKNRRIFRTQRKSNAEKFVFHERISIFDNYFGMISAIFFICICFWPQHSPSSNYLCTSPHFKVFDLWGGSNPKFQINIFSIIKLLHKLGNICEIKPLAALYTPHKKFMLFCVRWRRYAHAYGICTPFYHISI